MRWKETAPAMMLSTVTIITRNRCWRANWTMRWIMFRFRLRLRLVLQGILELQEEAAVADNAFAFLQTFRNLRVTTLTVSDFDQAARELIGAGLDVNEWLVFCVAKDGGVRNREGVANRARLDSGGDVHVFLEFHPGIAGDDARLQSACSRIKSRRNVGNF